MSNPISHSSLGQVQERSLFRRRIWKQIIDRVLTPVIRFLYRSRLKRLIGGTMVVLTHTGRKTGKTRKTVLYAKNYDSISKELMLVSAFGVTDWFLNICKQPAVLVEVGDVKYVPAQKILTVDEIADLERHFRQEHPLIARVQAWLMGWPWRCSNDEFLAFVGTLRGVFFWPNTPEPITNQMAVI